MTMENGSPAHISKTVPALSVRFHFLKPHIPEDILPASYRDVIERICRCFPAYVTPSLGFELHLSNPRPRVDFAFGVNQVRNGPWLSGALDAETIPEEWRRDPAWEGIRGYVRQWADAASPLGRHGGPVWMAYDLNDIDGPRLPFPCLYVSPVLIPLQAGTKIPEDRFNDVGEKSLGALLGDGFHRALWNRVLDCHRKLPAGGNIFQFGKMFSRKGSGLKICVMGLAPEEIAGYLEAVGWPGAIEPVRPLIRWASGMTDFLCFSLSLHPEGVGPDLGVECHYHGRRQPSFEPRWPLFLEGLVKRGLCSAEKKTALLAWPKIYRLPHNSRMQFLRRLSWIKLKWKNGSPEAKAYLGFAKISRSDGDNAAGPPA